MCEARESGEGSHDHHDDVGEVVAPEYGDLFEDVVQGVAVLEPLEEGLQEAFVLVEDRSSRSMYSL